MRNLAPHRNFKGVQNYKAGFRPYYRQPWPEDLPPHCKVCGTAFITGFNLDIGPSKSGRLLRKFAFYGIMPFMLGAFIIPAVISSHFGHVERGTLQTLFFTILFTPGILAFLSFLTPTRRRVECKKCGIEQYFKIPPAPHLPDVPEPHH